MPLLVNSFFQRAYTKYSSTKSKKTWGSSINTRVLAISKFVWPVTSTLKFWSRRQVTCFFLSSKVNCFSFLPTSMLGTDESPRNQEYDCIFKKCKISMSTFSVAFFCHSYHSHFHFAPEFHQRKFAKSIFE